jgi:hypothetical protein
VSVSHHRAPLVAREATPREPPSTSTRILLTCGPLSGLGYVLWHEAAALQWKGCNRISNAISELSLAGAPSEPMLDPREGIVYNTLVIAFGVGIWRAAGTSRALQVIGALHVLSGATAPLWVFFGTASLTAHLVLVGVSVLTWFGSMGFGAAASGRVFRIYSLVSLLLVEASFGLTLAYEPAVAAEESTPFIGLEERIGFSVFFLWQGVLATGLWRGRADNP